MSAVWIVPVLAVVFGGAVLVALLRTTAGSARELGAEIVRFGELQVAMRRLSAEVHESRRIVGDLRDR